MATLDTRRWQDAGYSNGDSHHLPPSGQANVKEEWACMTALVASSLATTIASSMRLLVPPIVQHLSHESTSAAGCAGVAVELLFHHCHTYPAQPGPNRVDPQIRCARAIQHCQRAILDLSAMDGHRGPFRRRMERSSGWAASR